MFISIGLYFILYKENKEIQKQNLDIKKESSTYENKTLDEKKIFDELKLRITLKFMKIIKKKFWRDKLQLEKSYIEENKDNINEKIIKKWKR